jgi:hypothetical protein
MNGTPRTTEPLWQRMRRLADERPERAAELRTAADELDGRCRELRDPSAGRNAVRSMLGAWARSLRLWCEITGEPLV